MTDRNDPGDTFPRLMELFEDELNGIAFPMVDVGILRAAANALEEQHGEVAKAESALQRSQAELSECRSELSALMVKALAYARVYASDNVELMSKIDALQPRRGAKTLGAKTLNAKTLNDKTVDAKNVRGKTGGNKAPNQSRNVDALVNPGPHAPAEAN